MGRPPSQPFASSLGGEHFAQFQQIPGRHDRHHLRGLMGYACHHDIKLAAVTDVHLDAYMAEPEVYRRIERTTQFRRDVAKSWNRMVDALPGWPRNRLTVVDNLGPRSLPLDAFPPSFAAEVREYLEAQPAIDDLFSESTHEAFADATKADRARKVRQLATLALELGTPAASLIGLQDLIREELVTAIVKHLWQASKRQRSSKTANLVRVLQSIAKHLKAPASLREALKAAQKKMRPKKTGMTQKNRERLRRAIDGNNLVKLLQLPKKVVTSVDLKRPSVTDAILVESALAVAIPQSAPMRVKNLAGLQKRHFDRVNETDCYIYIPGEEVKNGAPLHYKLPASVIFILDIYLKHYLPLLIRDKASTALFVSRYGRQKSPAELSTQITRFIRKWTGLQMNAHLFRHFAARMYLKEHPDAYESVKQLLGHRSVRTTTEYYTGQEVAETFARYDAILDRHGRGEGTDVTA
jgi:integrase